MQRKIAAVYTALALVSIAVSFAPLFPGVGLVRALPTAVLAAAVLPLTRGRFGMAIAVAVALGSVGDFCLASQSRTWFVPGLVAFLIGHLFYLKAFGRDWAVTGKRMLMLLPGIAGLALLTILTLLRLVRAEETGLIAPVLVYAAVLGATMAVCLFHRSPTPWIAAGGVVFVISDAHIAVNHMLLESPLLPITLSGYTTYYLAQYLLAHGAACESAAWDKR
ncbi:MAG: hypothetical protein GC168_09635 [Candidatus Hydrogenedens sp.]|nr:hypothetical protein [Candidatus Hydrogenedens sp.]